MDDIQRVRMIKEHIEECLHRIDTITSFAETNSDADKDGCQRNIDRLNTVTSSLKKELGIKSPSNLPERKMTLDEAIQHCQEKSDCTVCGEQHRHLREWMKELQQYQVIGTPEECREAVERQQAIPARKTTIFEGKDAEKLAAKGLPNFETYKCQKCGRSVAERTLARTLHPDGYIKHKFCSNCGQAIDWSDAE